jgi:hypothetical protein
MSRIGIRDSNTLEKPSMWKHLLAAVARFFLLRKDESAEGFAICRKHTESVRAFASIVAPGNAIAFAVATAERQFVPFASFCEEQHLADIAVVRQTLDAVWAWVRDSEPIPTSVMSNLVALFPVQDESGEANDDWPHGFALEYLCSLELLVETVTCFDAKAVVSMADTAISAIDYVLQETSNVPIDTPAWYTQKLFVLEMERQSHDQATLQHPLKTSLVDELRQRSQGVSVTGDLTFLPSVT